MTDSLVVEWMTEWKSLTQDDPNPDKVTELAQSLLNNEDLFQAITHVLEENERFRSVSLPPHTVAA
jgi:hypothetical protein